MKPKKPLAVQLRYASLAIRFMVFSFLLWQIHETDAVLNGNTLDPRIPESLAALHVLLCSLLIFPFKESKLRGWFAIAADLAVGAVFLILYQGDITFSAPFFLATYTAGTLSWSSAFLVAIAGSVLLLGDNFYRQGLSLDSLSHPVWLYVLALNFLISAMALFKAETTRLGQEINTLVSLIETGQQFGAGMTYEKIFQIDVSLAKDLFGARLCAVYMRDADGSMKIRASEAPEPNLFRDFHPKTDPTVLKDVIDSKQAVIVDDFFALPESTEKVIPRSKNYRGGMAAPFIVAGELAGFIFLAGKYPKMYDSDSQRLLKILAAQTSLAMRNVQLREKTQALAVTDSVSGLYTYGYMLEALEREFRRCKAANLPISAALLDVDQFKEINDEHGHASGDSLLRQTATIIKTMTRSSDIVCRHGADKFMIIFPETNRLGAIMVAERIRQAVELYEFVLGSKVVQVTLSAGVSNFPEDSVDSKFLLDNANLALFMAKDQGKNKVSYPQP